MITCYEKGEKKYKHDVMTYGFKSDNVSDRANTVDSVLKVSSSINSNVALPSSTVTLIKSFFSLLSFSDETLSTLSTVFAHCRH